MAIKKPKPYILYIRNIPRDLKQRFKSFCDLRGVTMNERICQLVQADVNKEERRASNRSSRAV